MLGIRIPNSGFFLRLFSLGSEKAVFEAALRQNRMVPTPELVQRFIRARSAEFVRALRGVNEPLVRIAGDNSSSVRGV